MQADRGQWGSTAGFVLAAAGSAIGLGNIWRFPYTAGQNGGAAFIAIYLICVLLICLPYMFAELAIGRHTKRNPVGAIRAIAPGTPWILVGAMGVLAGMLILSYYGVIAGWAFGYIFKEIIAPGTTFGEFIATPMIVVPLFGLFIFFTVMVVVGGVQHGIEKWARILMPMLLVLMFIMVIRSVTLPGAGEGIAFLVNPDFSKVTPTVILAALGQAFYSLSLGMGAMITYGSYLPKSTNLRGAGIAVAAADTGIALVAGFMIFPALFALGGDPAGGPALIFDVLPKIFAAMPGGAIFSIVFFVLLSIAALTSTVSILEVPVSYVVDERKWSRKKAAWGVGLLAFLVGIPSVLSNGANDALSNMTFLGQTGFLGIMDFIWGNIALAMGALLMSIFVGWVWGLRRASSELREGGDISETGVRVWGVFIQYICPIVIFIVLLNVFGVFGQ